MIYVPHVLIRRRVLSRMLMSFFPYASFMIHMWIQSFFVCECHSWQNWGDFCFFSFKGRFFTQLLFILLPTTFFGCLNSSLSPLEQSSFQRFRELNEFSSWANWGEEKWEINLKKNVNKALKGGCNLGKIIFYY